MSDIVMGLAEAKPAPEGWTPTEEWGVDPTTDDLPRCWWGASTVDYAHYHDTEWGRAVDDDRTLFEKLCLEGFQSGLSWLTILRKRDGFRRAFDHFEAGKMATYDDGDVERLLGDASIVRHRGKIEAVINNAQALVAMHQDGETLAELVWSFQPEDQVRTTMAEVPATTPESAALAKALKKRGFRFVGPTTAYAAMQAMGVVNDHMPTCWAHPLCASPDS